MLETTRDAQTSGDGFGPIQRSLVREPLPDTLTTFTIARVGFLIVGFFGNPLLDLFSRETNGTSSMREEFTNLYKIFTGPLDTLASEQTFSCIGASNTNGFKTHWRVAAGCTLQVSFFQGVYVEVVKSYMFSQG